MLFLFACTPEIAVHESGDTGADSGLIGDSASESGGESDSGTDSGSDSAADSAGDSGSEPVDADSDGFDNTTDCNDSDPDIHPEAAETCGDRVDQDCDGADLACEGFDAALSAADVIWEGDLWDHAGQQVLAPGDMDADGYDDLIIGAEPGADWGSPKPTYYLIRGGPSLTGGFLPDVATAVWTDNESYDHYGDSIGPLGDIDGDGFPAFAVTTWDSYSGTEGVFGIDASLSSGEIQSAAFVVRPSAACPYFGDSIASGDSDGDGQGDLFIGDPNMDAAGGGYFWFGGLATEQNCESADARLVGESDHPKAGTVALSGKDLDGDGLHEWVLGNSSSTAGAVYVLANPAAGRLSLSASDARIAADATAPYFGARLALVQDGNGDGYDELLAGSPAETPSSGSAAAGVVRLWQGPLVGDLLISSANLVLEGDASLSGLGSTVADASGLLGTGAVAASAPFATVDGLDYAGIICVIAPGRTGTLTPADCEGRLSGEAAGDYAGWSMADVGDLNGDGNPDFVTGAFEAFSWDGHAALFLGPGL